MKAGQAVTSAALFLLLPGLVPNATAQSQIPAPKVDLGQASLEDLLNINVTSVSKRQEKLSRVAAAIFVITQEDIRRSGAINIPDLLRMAPGVDVEQINANTWAISIRGFNSQYSNKVLVLVDGRTVYSPNFSGVSWDQLEVPLGDIDRIEVLRGPGATVWGANAVNGVISIITKSSKDTKGGQLTAGGGSQTQGIGQARYGGSIGQHATYRVFGDFFDFGNSAAKSGGAANDRWKRMQVGFRSDWDLSLKDSLMVQGNLFSNRENGTGTSDVVPTPFTTVFPFKADASGGNLVARWNHTLEGGSQTSFQTYYDTYRRSYLGLPAEVHTLDFDFQHHLTAGDRHDIVWGLGYRANYSAFASGYAISLSPLKKLDNFSNVFLQDEIRITDSVWLTLGAKLEHNGYTGFQTEPSMRLVWAPPNGHQTIWAAASKATREPSRADTALEIELQRFPLNENTEVVSRLSGNPHIQVEEIRDYELGYRAELSKNISLDAASFLSFYHHLESTEPLAPAVIPGVPVVIEIPYVFENKAHARDFGGELFLTWKAKSHWRISPGYSYLHAQVRLDADSHGLASSAVSTDFPGNVFQVRSLLNLSRNIEFDQSLYYTARLPGGTIPGHARLDLRLARRLGEFTEISLVGQNLLHRATLEYGDGLGVVGTQSPRSIYGKVTWRF